MSSRINKANGHKRFLLLLMLLLMMAFLRYGLQLSFPRIILLVPIIAIVVIGNQTEILATLICLIPLHESIDLYYAVVICLMAYVFKYFRRIRINFAVILVLLMVIWELIHCFSEDFSLVTFVTSLVPLITLAALMSSDSSEADYTFIVRMLAYTTVAVGITMFTQVLRLTNFKLSTALVSLRRLGMLDQALENRVEVSGGIIHANSLGIISVLIVTGLLQLRYNGQGKKGDILLAIILLFFGILTASRTFLVCLFLMVAMFYFTQCGGQKKVQYLAMIIVVSFLGIGLFGYFFPNQLEYFISRFYVSDISTGRTWLMELYGDFITDNPKVLFFGLGLHNCKKILLETYSFPTVPHNSIQEIIIAWGLPGLLLIFLLIVLMIWLSRRYISNHKLTNYIPLVILLVKSLAGQLLTSGYTMLALSYAYLSLAQDFTNKREITK